ncbi:MAG: flagellar hook protein FlgE [Sulfurospirillum sp.]|nr:flagellar hook protein FlgE [Sulfurospirillum sp.]MBL0703609.1 flagellar hook protein FlgE [Sulfurospirillum sp.]
MNSSFYNGISGTVTQQFGINVWANNIANVNTVGYKGNIPEFSTLFASKVADLNGPTTNSLGYGSRPSGTAKDMSQGTFQSSDNVFDLSLGAEGWFGVQSNNETLYTRAGAFSVDGNGYMVDANGNYLLGTLGGNITPTELPTEIMEQFGIYYGKDTNELGSANKISNITDIPLGSVDGQTRINLPDILYYPPEATTKVSYSGNFDSSIAIDSTQTSLNDADIATSINMANQTISIKGTISNTSGIKDPKESDVVLITITDANGETVEVSSSLDANLNWVVTDEDISSLDTSSSLATTAKLVTTEETANVEHFSSTIISPTGEKDILDMTYTKRVPQLTPEASWDGVIQILSFHEKYDSSKTYDPNLYKVDKESGDVYKIKDKKDAFIEFGESGEILNLTMPTMSNGGTPLDIDAGEPNSFNGFISNESVDRPTSQSHDGYNAGFLKDYGMDQRGNIIAEFDNGKSVPIAKVAVYHFQNDQGLVAVGGTSFRGSPNSGNPIFYTDENGNAVQGTQVFSNRLENGNVDLSMALTELIVMQKAFDANAQSITTSDEMIKNALNMKR